ncbi:AAA family ATPase [Spirillospora sp. NPDC048911]|uniref:AAA family ATPase n=1 Tax=Spirillospora sp. NPDC048911 TaxID=3364527 RepID=UPI00371A9575
MLHGRGTERAAIDEVVAAARAGTSRVLVLRGEAGVGKSALLDQAATAAGAEMRVLRASGVEPEAGLAFAALHQLLWPVIGLLDALPEPQRRTPVHADRSTSRPVQGGPAHLGRPRPAWDRPCKGDSRPCAG